MARAEERIIAIPSHWGAECRNSLLIPPDAKGLAAILPGHNYNCDRPLLHLGRFAALQRGWVVLSVEYGYYRAGIGLKSDFIGTVVEESRAAVEKACAAVEGSVLLLGKSLGTLALGEISKDLADGRNVSHIYLTPVPDTVPHILRTGGLVLAGDADGAFPADGPDGLISLLGGVAGVDLHLFARANHSLEVPGDTELTLSYVKEAVGLIDGYIGTVSKKSAGS